MMVAADATTVLVARPPSTEAILTEGGSLTRELTRGIRMEFRYWRGCLQRGDFLVAPAV